MKTLPNKITFHLDRNLEVSVTGCIAPIEYTQYDFHVKWDELANLQVTEPEKQHPASIFCDFLPKEATSVGTLWEIEHAGVLKLLKQLHPEPNLDMHLNSGDSCGLWACLRAYNDTFADIVFRIHAEFILEDGWFTPSQFTGHLVIDRIKETVTSFHMYVPQGVLNFDVNWKKDKDEPGTIADIGFCPQIELRAGTENVVSNTEFIESITQEEAEHKLIRCFYKSQQINWVSLEEALEIAPAQQRPIHAISINGPLADESC